MPVFVIFVFGAVVFGTGMMLAPALPTRQPRVGLAAALALALVIGGAVFWGLAFGWDTLVVDYIVFFLVSAIFLGGTLSYGQRRAEQRGEILSDEDQGWPGPQDLLMFGGMALLIIVVLSILPSPLAMDASAPTAGESTTDSPGFRALAAYLTGALRQSPEITQFSISGVLLLLAAWLGYDLGAEVKNKQWGRVLTVLTALLVGIELLLFPGVRYPALLALVFALALVMFGLRYLKYQYPVDAFCAALMLGAVALCHLPTLLVMSGLYMVGLIVLAARGGLNRQWLIALAIPVLAVIATLPYVLRGGIVESYRPDTISWALPILIAFAFFLSRVPDPAAQVERAAAKTES